MIEGWRFISLLVDEMLGIKSAAYTFSIELTH